MHEISIVNSIVKTLKEEFEKDELDRLKRIHIKVGILSNVEPRLLHNAFEAYQVQDRLFGQVSLEIEPVSIKIRCDGCGQLTDVMNYRFLCSKCGLPSKNIVEGEELLIHKVEFEDQN